MKSRRTAEQDQVADLLRTARDALGLSLAFFSRLDGTTQHLEVVETAYPMFFKDGQSMDQPSSLCQAIMDKKLPSVIPDLKKFPVAMALPAAKMPRIRSYVSVPITLSDGTLYGTFCAAGFTSDKGLSKRDKALMQVLARAAAVVVEPSIKLEALRTEIESRLLPLMDSGGPTVVLQPIVNLGTGERVGAEALSRFPAQWAMAPDICFAQAHSIGLGDALELMALRLAAEHLSTVRGYVSMNVSPATLLSPGCLELLHSMPADRILLELSEHDAVADYDALNTAITALREGGMRLAIDDVGAGFSSLRHIVLTSPDVIKLDRSIVDGVSADPVIRTLVRSLLEFGHGCGASVVAEGVETAEDAAMLREIGVDAGQGYYWGRPGPAAELDAILPKQRTQPMSQNEIRPPTTV